MPGWMDVASRFLGVKPVNTYGVMSPEIGEGPTLTQTPTKNPGGLGERIGSAIGSESSQNWGKFADAILRSGSARPGGYAPPPMIPGFQAAPPTPPAQPIDFSSGGATGMNPELAKLLMSILGKR